MALSAALFLAALRSKIYAEFLEYVSPLSPSPITPRLKRHCWYYYYYHRHSLIGDGTCVRATTDSPHGACGLPMQAEHPLVPPR